MTILLAFFFSLSLYAQEINKIFLEDVNLEYVAPKGTGTLERISLGFGKGKALGPYPVEVTMEEKAILVQSPIVDLTWEDYPPFLASIRKLSTEKLNASVSKKEHYLKAYNIAFSPAVNQNYGLRGVSAHCQGESLNNNLLYRVMDDCRQSLSVSVTKINGSLMRYVLDVLSDPPENLVEELGPNDLEASIKEGNFFFNLGVKFIIRARARAWGEIFYENDYKTIAIRIDQVKYGIVPITWIVLNQMRSRIKHPNVKVTPPWIRINLELP